MLFGFIDVDIVVSSSDLRRIKAQGQQREAVYEAG